MHHVVYEENILCPIILGHIYIVENCKFERFYGFTWWRNTGIYDFTGWKNMCMMWYIKKICCDQLF